MCGSRKQPDLPASRHRLGHLPARATILARSRHGRASSLASLPCSCHHSPLLPRAATSVSRPLPGRVQTTAPRAWVLCERGPPASGPGALSSMRQALVHCPLVPRVPPGLPSLGTTTAVPLCSGLSRACPSCRRRPRRPSPHHRLPGTPPPTARLAHPQAGSPSLLSRTEPAGIRRDLFTGSSPDLPSRNGSPGGAGAVPPARVTGRLLP